MFYVLFSEDRIIYSKKWAYFEEIKPINIGGYEKCPVCGKAVSMLEWLPPFNIKISTKNKKQIGDFIWGTDFPFLISDQFRKIYEKEELKGLLFAEHPINIANWPMGDHVPELILHKVKLHWNGARKNDVQSGAIYDGSGCSFCYGGSILKRMDRIVILENSWNDDDFFQIVGLGGLVIVTEKCKLILEKFKFQNYSLVPIENIGYDERAPLLWVVNNHG